jgi:hypothetical protein
VALELRRSLEALEDVEQITEQSLLILAVVYGWRLLVPVLEQRAG